jgi:hypothetical protein
LFLPWKVTNLISASGEGRSEERNGQRGSPTGEGQVDCHAIEELKELAEDDDFGDDEILLDRCAPVWVATEER